MEKSPIKAPKNTTELTQAAKTAAPAKVQKQANALTYLQGDAFKRQLAAALPKFFDTDRFTRAAMSEFRLNPALQDCSVPSVLGYFMQAAMSGLEPSSTLGQCYPVPFNNHKTGQRECQFIMGYRGMLSLARRSGEVQSVSAEVVHEKDTFELTYGLEQNLIHKPFTDGDPGKVTGAYCIVRFKDGSYQMKHMSIYEIEQRRKRSKAGSFGPWKTDFEEMCKKTVFRNLFKWLPISIEAGNAMAADDNVVNYKPDGDGEEAIEISFTGNDDLAQEEGAEE